MIQASLPEVRDREARAYLGLAGLAPGAPADAVIYAQDPRLDLSQLSHPTAVILRGQRVR